MIAVGQQATHAFQYLAGERINAADVAAGGQPARGHVVVQSSQLAQQPLAGTGPAASHRQEVVSCPGPGQCRDYGLLPRIDGAGQIVQQIRQRIAGGGLLIVAAEVANNRHPLPRQGSVAALRDRWKSQSGFIADVINFAMWSGTYPDRLYEQTAALTQELLDGPDMTDAAHELAYMEVRETVDAPSRRLSFAAMISAEGDPTIAAAVANNYDEYFAPKKCLRRSCMPGVCGCGRASASTTSRTSWPRSATGSCCAPSGTQAAA